jgi:hypothetical protein
VSEFITIDVGFDEIDVPAEATQEQIDHIAKVHAASPAYAAFMASPAFDALVDKKTGSPATVRALVGSSSRPEDKLKNSVRLVAECPYR